MTAVINGNMYCVGEFCMCVRSVCVYIYVWCVSVCGVYTCMWCVL